MYIIISFIPHVQTYTVHTIIPKIQCPDLVPEHCKLDSVDTVDIKLNLPYVYINLQLNIIIFT
jgi:hypothetical protein